MPPPTRDLLALADGLWVVSAPLSFLGWRVGTRMTIVRLGDGGLWLHSPVPMDARLKRAVDALGPVRYLVAPNLYHHLHLRETIRAYPQAKVFGAPGLAKKRKDVRFDELLGSQPPPAWRDDLDQLLIEGTLLNEVVFYHRHSRTLITSDLAVNFVHTDHWWTRLYLKASGVDSRFGLSLLLRVCYRDRTRARACLDRLLEWDFDRVIVAHGEVLETGGHETVRRTFAWLNP